MYPDTIIKWIVRIPGNRANWSEHRTEKAAKREAIKADRIAPGHRVYAQHKSGNTTGPY